MKKPDPFRTLTDICDRLDRARIHYTVARYRADAVSVQATVPGERWEIDVLNDGTVDFERFVTAGDIHDRAALQKCIAEFAEV